MKISRYCAGLFIDVNHSLYCSIQSDHQVVKGSLKSSTNPLTSVAGNCSAGSASNQLNHPHGIFVDTNSNLYVADCHNHRIQLFHPGQLNGTTIAGSKTETPTIDLRYPTGIILDSNNYIYIVDSGNHRIVGEDPNGFRCIVGCSGYEDSGSKMLAWPFGMAFDSHGNIFVSDHENFRIQKFMLAKNSCGKRKVFLLF
jgi:DNA-binding beta-propeller fold protein YncE